MSDSIELVIKAANGSVDDFKMTAQRNWTVTQVKNHIYRHYPTHPPLSSQRLIHSGRMLLDQQTLLEALPDISNIIQPVIIHLVAYERSASAPVLSQSSTRNINNTVAAGAPPTRTRSTASRQPSLTPVQEAADGGVAEGERGGAAPPAPHPQQQQAAPQQQQQHPWLRYRGNGQFQQQQQQQANFAPAVGPFFAPMAGGFPPPQMAGGFQPGAAGMMPAGPGFANGQFYPQPQYNPFNQQQMMAQYWGYYNQFGRAPAAAGRGGGEAAMTSEGGEVVEDLDLQNLQELANNADADEQDIPMNAGGLGMMGGGGGAAQLRRHRDLVDYLYMLTMMGFLALIAYVTGSFGRLMVFAGGIIFMMLNQRGWFSLQRRRQGDGGRQRDERNPLERVAQQQRQEREGEGEGEGREEREDLVDGGEQEEANSQRRVETGGGETQVNAETDDEQATQQLPENEQGQALAEGEEEEEEGLTRGQEATPTPQPQQEPHPPVEEPAPPRPGALRTILIFVTSFFTSLVPQQRPEFQFN